jgi:TetR/AcrR family transcriptional regulator
MAWANSPHPDSLTDDSTIIARRRAAAVEAATRIIATHA